MSKAEFMPVFTEHFLVPVLTALSAAVVGLLGWIGTAAKRKFDAQATLAQADTYARDLAALVGLLQRRAVAEVANSSTPPPTPQDLVAYAERVKPDLLAKMSPAPEALETMAQAAIASATVAAPDVLLPPRV